MEHKNGARTTVYIEVEATPLLPFSDGCLQPWPRNVVLFRRSFNVQSASGFSLFSDVRDYTISDISHLQPSIAPMGVYISNNLRPRIPLVHHWISALHT
ncbi:hypothetical protein N0V85_006705 [Neurospora sp. IMI 360204]|nr:hypothetical protein N0V85_006705 [Neurospora sp. IMI 360204]